MSFTNPFSSGAFLCDEVDSLPIIPGNQDCIEVPRLSQVCALILVPEVASNPGDWTSTSSWNQVIDNTDSGKAKFIVGKGEVPAHEDIIVNAGRSVRLIGRRRYSLNFDIGHTDDNTYEMLRTLQRGFVGKFWFGTLGGRLIGGPQGIKADLISPRFIYSGGDTDFENCNLSMEWYADIDPERTDLPGLLNVPIPTGSVGTSYNGEYTGPGSNPSDPSDPSEPDPGGGGVSGVAYFRQAYPNQGGASLTWTENSGALPTSNQNAQVWVFQRGNKLDPDVEYSIAGSTITIDSNVHFSGADYEVFAFITS